MPRKTNKAKLVTLSPREIPDDNDDNPFIRLVTLLDRHAEVFASPADLATAIELYGVYGWDRYGRYKKFSADSPEAQEALSLIEDVYAYEQDPHHDDVDQQHPLDQIAGSNHPYQRYGWATKALPDFDRIRSVQPQPQQPPLENSRTERTYLNIIGGLLELILSKTPSGKPNSLFSSQAAVVDSLLAHFPKKAGLSKRTLDAKFAIAKQSLSQSD